MTQKEKEYEETLRRGLIEALLGTGFRQVDDEFVNLSLLERNLRREVND